MGCGAVVCGRAAPLPVGGAWEDDAVARLWPARQAHFARGRKFGQVDLAGADLALERGAVALERQFL